MKINVLLLSLFLLSNNAYATHKSGAHPNNIGAYSNKACYEIYEAIGAFLYLADREWRFKNVYKGVLYSSAAANYSTVFNTVCKSKNN
ncbi:MAG: hypothetical protein NZ824_11665 [Candidatus Thioglobus sp.]|nr:hypothetical protein [Candidatus Thioglobus sp.]